MKAKSCKSQKLEESFSFHVNEGYMPEYVSLRKKYGCDNCKRYISGECYGHPYKRTQCKKRCWVFYDLFILLTAIIISSAYVCSFSYFQDLLLSLAYTIIFAVIMDMICCFIEYVVDKVFENMEIWRRRKYDKKVANIAAMNEARRQDAEREKEKENVIYKDINEAKLLFSSLSNEYLDKLTKSFDESERFPELKNELLNSYKELLKNIELLLSQITLDNFYFPEIKVLFQMYLPKLREHISAYIESIVSKKETDSQISELIELLEAFNARISHICENLSNSESESIVYKMQALRKVVSHTNYEEDKK